jgi:CHC2-type zinc finger protein/TOTE conflict system primase-like protein
MKEQEKNELYAMAEALAATFVNRQDCFAVQTDSGQYYSVKENLTVNHIVHHLKGNMTLGTYLLGSDGKAKFAVIDADDDEGFAKLLRAQEALRFTSYMERSRRGGHLWFFFEEPVVGKVAKNFGLEIAKGFLIEAEVFPKQSESQGPGSSIRLPFGIHKKTGTRYPFIGLGNWKAQLDALTNPKRVPILEVMKYQYQEPERRRTTPIYPETRDLPLWEKVKRQITVEELVSEYVDLKRNGIGQCPFHDDLNPSFSVNVKENYWQCFSGCGGGSVIDFWMKMNDLDFKEATKDLAERLGVK